MARKYFITKTFCYLFVCFLTFSTVQAQEDFIETNEPISSFAVSKNDSILTFLSGPLLYWVDIDRMQVLNKFNLQLEDKNFNWEVLKFANNGVVILKKVEFYISYNTKRLADRYSFREYPGDSYCFF